MRKLIARQLLTRRSYSTQASQARPGITNEGVYEMVDSDCSVWCILVVFEVVHLFVKKWPLGKRREMLHDSCLAKYAGLRDQGPFDSRYHSRATGWLSINRCGSSSSFTPFSPTFFAHRAIFFPLSNNVNCELVFVWGVYGEGQLGIRWWCLVFVDVKIYLFLHLRVNQARWGFDWQRDQCKW